MEPRTRAKKVERQCRPPSGPGERFRGWGVMGLPFDSGHVLALRRFPASSVGPAYSSVWHRGPDGAWTMYVDVAPRRSCPRYFGAAVTRVVETQIVVSWADARTFRVITGNAGFHWDVTVAPTPITRLMNGLARPLPEAAWHSRSVLRLLGRLAGTLLRAGTVRLHGRVPNGHRFLANPRRVWAVTGSSAVVEGVDIGAPGPLNRQARLRDFWIPQRGLLAFVDNIFETAEAAASA